MYSSEMIVCGAIDSTPFCMPVGMLYEFVKISANAMLGSTPGSTKLLTSTMKLVVNGIQYCPTISIWKGGSSYLLKSIEESSALKDDFEFRFANSPQVTWCICKQGKNEEGKLNYTLHPASQSRRIEVDILSTDYNRKLAVADLASIAAKVADVYCIPKEKLTDEIYRVPWNVNTDTHFEFVAGHMTGKVRSTPRQNLVYRDGYKELESRNVIYKHHRFYLNEMRTRGLLSGNIVDPKNSLDIFESIQITESEVSAIRDALLCGSSPTLFQAFKSIVTADQRFGRLLYGVWENYPVQTLPPTLLSFSIPDISDIFSEKSGYNMVMNLQFAALAAIRGVRPMIETDGWVTVPGIQDRVTSANYISVADKAYHFELGEHQWQ